MALELSKPKHFSVFNKQGGRLFGSLKKLVEEGRIYQHQAKAVQAIKKDLFENQCQPQAGNADYSKVSLVVLPTGTGKTGVGVLAAYACSAERVLVVTPSMAISKQQLTQFMPVNDTNFNPLQNKPFLLERGVFTADRSQYDHWVPISKCVLKASELQSILEERCELVISNAHKFGDGSGRGVDIKEFPRNHFSLVIVDEAHHFPAKTWKNIVDHFQEGELILFLTATPFNKGDPILPSKKPCYELLHEDAVSQGIIRETCFFEVSDKDYESDYGQYTNDNGVILRVLHKVKDTLIEHDFQDTKCAHKAMILAKDKDYARNILELWEMHHNDFGICRTFIEDDGFSNVKKFMEQNDNRVLVVIYRLTEGFDCKAVSVAAILRNVHKRSRVYFSQFVGRAVRKLHRDDPVSATIISHKKFNQGENYDEFKSQKLAEDISVDTLGIAADIEQELD